MDPKYIEENGNEGKVGEKLTLYIYIKIPKYNRSTTTKKLWGTKDRKKKLKNDKELILRSEEKVHGYC